MITYFFAMILPITLLGASFFFYTAISVKNEINLRLKNIFLLMEKQLDQILNVSSDLNLLFSNNPRLTLTVSKILNAQSLNYLESNYYNMIMSILNTTANSKLFIDSVYLYQDNSLGNYLCSGLGIVNIKDSWDTDWLDIYQATPKYKILWITKRYLKHYQFEQSKPVISIFHRLSNMQGVIVFNLKSDKFTNNLDTLQMYKSQAIIVTNSTKTLLFSNTNAYSMQINENLSIDQQFIKRININSNNMFLVNFNGQNYLMTETYSNKYDLYFILLLSQKEIYGPLEKILLFICFAVFVSFFISFSFSYSLTKKSFRQLDVILKILQNAENSVYINTDLSIFRDEYDIILHNILKTFIKNNYLKLQLNEAKLRQKNAELTALQLQINPHFLFNTLQLINIEILKINPTVSPASKLVENLSDILKYSLGNPNNTVRLHDEIQYTKKYLDIMYFRYPNKFMVFWDYDENVLDTPIIRFLFQPLIENSIYHGIKPKHGKGLIKVRISKKNDGLYVRISDNGIGISKPELEQLRKELNKLDFNFDEKHIGLKNVNKRLILFYGPQSMIKINSKYNWGTVISFFIPITPYAR